MKTNNFMHLMAAAAVFAGMVMFTSCNKDDFELPEVIESEVLDEGLSEEITTESTEQGTKLSYESWIMVKGQTRAAFENKVSVTLNSVVEDMEDTVEVYNWDIGDYQVSYNHEVAAQRTEGFVNVTDSILVYTVKFDEFSFDYRLNYEVAVYDDGVTRQTMPYYYYANIKDNGGTLEVADSYADRDFSYARRIYRHSITVEFGGQTYEVEARITLKRTIGFATDPYIVRSEVLEKTLTPNGDGSVTSSIRVKSIYSNATTTNQQYMATLPVLRETTTGKEITVHGSPEDVELRGVYIEEKSRIKESDSEYVILERITDDCVLRYGDFDLTVSLVHYAAMFDNIVLQEDMGGHSYSADDVSVKSMDWRFIETNGDKDHYFLELVVELNIGDLKVEGVYNGWFVFTK